MHYQTDGNTHLDEPLVLVRGRGAQRSARARRRPGRAALYPRGPAGSAQFPGNRVSAAGSSGLPTPAPLLIAICCTGKLKHRILQSVY